MSVNLKDRKKRDPLINRITVPATEAQKERYARIQNELEQRNFDSLHELTRECIDTLLDEVETELDSGVRIDAC